MGDFIDGRFCRREIFSGDFVAGRFSRSTTFVNCCSYLLKAFIIFYNNPSIISDAAIAKDGLGPNWKSEGTRRRFITLNHGLVEHAEKIILSVTLPCKIC